MRKFCFRPTSLQQRVWEREQAARGVGRVKSNEMKEELGLALGVGDQVGDDDVVNVPYVSTPRLSTTILDPVWKLSSFCFTIFEQQN